MSRCLSEAQIRDLVDQRLEAGERMRIEDHLAGCSHCRALVIARKEGVAVPEAVTRSEAETLLAPEGALQAPPDGDHRLAPGGPPPRNPLDFADYLKKSKLVDAETVDLLLASFSGGEDAGAVNQFAQELVEKNELTAYQAAMLLSGRWRGLVLGNYEILDRIGQGGMGMVFKARHRRMNRVVALKTLPSSMIDSPDAVSRFHREVEAAAKLQHSNIVSAYDADEAEGIHFLVMEFVEGPNLSAYVKQVGPLPLGAATQLVAQAARGLAHAHSKGVVHRDIKPGNLLIDQQGTVKVLDMGLAQLHAESEYSAQLSELTQSGRVMGTVDYMAPEQALDAKRVDHRADIYSLGCTLYYLLTAKTVAPEGSLASKVLWHQNQTPPPLAEVCSEAPRELAELFDRMVAKDPADRPQTMADVLDELNRCLQSMDEGRIELPELGIYLSCEAPSTQRGSGTAAATLSQQPTKIDESPSEEAEEPAPVQPQPPRKKDRSRTIAYIATIVLAVAALTTATMVALNEFEPPGPVAGKTEEESQQGPVKKNAPSVLAHQALLEWVFQLGGQVTIKVENGREQRIARIEQAPAEAFDVLGVHLEASGVRDVDLQQLGDTPQITNLTLGKTQISDEGLHHLASLRDLETLDLSQTQVTNDGLASLARLSQLRELNLQGTAVTDPGLGHLAPLQKLANLFLSDTRVSDAGVGHLTGLGSLARLALNGTQLTSEGHDVLLDALPGLSLAWDGESVDRVVANKLLGKGVTLSLVTQAGRDVASVRRQADLPPARFHVTKIDATNLADVNDEDLKLIAGLTRIQELTLGGTDISADGLRQLHGLTTLEVLDLGALRLPQASTDALQDALPTARIVTRVPGDELAARWALQQKGAVTVATPGGETLSDIRSEQDLPEGDFVLRSVQLDDTTALADDDLERFQDLTELEKLYLTAEQLTDQAVSYLAGCQSLQDLALRGAQLSPEGLSQLAQLPSLRRLYLFQAQVDGEGLRQLGQAKQLTHLSLAETTVVDSDLEHLKRLRELAWLSLTNTQLTDAAIEPLGELPQLRDLFLEGTNITDAGLEELQVKLASCSVTGNPPDLNRLTARWVLEQGGAVQLETGPLSGLADLPRQSCKVIQVNLSQLPDLSAEMIMEKLNRCQHLEEIDLSEIQLLDQHLASLAQLQGLKCVRLNMTLLSDEGLSYLANLPQLRHLELRGTRVRGTALSKFSALPDMEVLDLSSTQVDDRSLVHLHAAVKLAKLDLSSNTRITDTGVSHLQDLTNLQELLLRGTRLTDTGMQHLSRMTQLRVLDLDGTGVTDRGLACLKEMRQLQKLCLYRTKISDATLELLSDLTTLRHLNVDGTNVSDGAVARFRQTHPGCRVTKRPNQPRDPNLGRTRG